MIQRWDEEIPVNLTDTEIRQYGKDLASVLDKLSDVRAEKKEADADFKKRIQEIESTVRDLTRKISTGKEERKVPLKAVENKSKWEVDIYREDTGELVRSRPMTAEERQANLFDKTDEKQTRQRSTRKTSAKGSKTPEADKGKTPDSKSTTTH